MTPSTLFHVDFFETSVTVEDSRRETQTERKDPILSLDHTVLKRHVDKLLLLPDPEKKQSTPRRY